MAQAARDLETARWLAEGRFHEWACFAAQQAAEKALKAVYEARGGVSWGHSVAGLLRGLLEKAEVPEGIIDDGRTLDRFYLPARYPNGWEAGSPQDYYTAEDATDAIDRADRIVRLCQGLLAG